MSTKPTGIEVDGKLSVTDVVDASLGEPALICEHDGLGTVAETKLGEDARYVGFHGCCTDEEFL